MIRRLAEHIDLPIQADDEIKINHDQIVIYRDHTPIFFFNQQLFVFLDAEGLIYTSIKAPLRDHPIFPYLDQTPDYCFCNVSESIVVLAHDPKETRLEFNHNQVTVYQMLDVSGQKERYQLIPLHTLAGTQIQFERSFLKFPTNSNHYMHGHYYFSDQLRCWASLTERKAYILQKDRVMYTVDNNNLFYHDIHDPSLRMMHYSGQQAQIESFEESELCHRHLTTDTFNGHMDLVRYPELRFEIEAGRLYYGYHENKYVQVLQGVSLFTPAAKVSHLVFQHPEQATQQIALLTIQKFSQEHSGVHIIQTNHSRHTPDALKTTVYHVDTDTATLTTHNATDALYLAYVYAATYDYDKAIATLNSLNLVDLQTNQDETTILKWMVQLTNGDPYRLAACQMKAFTLYVRCVQEKFSNKLNCETQLLALMPKMVECYNVYITHANYLPNAYLLDDLAVNSFETFSMAQSVTLRQKKITSYSVSAERLNTNFYHSSDELPQNLLHTPEGVISISSAISQLNSNFEEKEFPKYLATFVKMTQSAEHKSLILHFCQSFIKGHYSSSYALILLFLCQQKVDLSSGILSLDKIKTGELPSEFHYDTVHTTSSTGTLPKPTAPVPSSITRLPLVHLEPLTAMTDLIKTQYPEFYQAYSTLDTEQNDAFASSMPDTEFGALKQEYSDRKLTLIKRTFESANTRQQLLILLEERKNNFDKQLKKQWSSAFEIANQALISNHYYLLQAGYYSLLTEQDLMSCYAASAQDLYAAMTTLKDVPTIQTLHEHIHQAMLTSLQYQQFQRLIDELNNIQKQGDTIIRWGKLLDLMLREHVPSLNARADMIHLEVSKNIMIRPDQKLMSDGLQTSARIIDAFTGAGKTTVVIPMTVSQIPEKTLFVVIVLRALLKTTHAYLHKVGAKINQVPYLFDFHRNDKSTPQALLTKQHLFEELVHNNNPAKPHYLVSTADSIQSLGLKFLEFVWVKQYKEYEKQILALEPMLLLLLQHGLAIIDEIHEIQDDYKSPVRYAIDKPMGISLELVQDVVGLYRFKDENPSHSRAEMVQRLLESPESPMQKYLRTCIKNNPQVTPVFIKDAITNFILKKQDYHFDITPRFRRYLETVQSQMRLFEYVKHVFYKQHYGPSKLKTLTALKRILAIPYSKNEKPKHGSHFENPQEYIVYTIEGLLREFPYDACEELIQTWLDQASIELQNSSDQFHNFEETPAAVRFRDLFGFELNPDFLHDKQKITAVWTLIKTNRNICYDLLEYDILPTIEIDCTVIESRAFDHLFSYRSASGLTATPDMANQNLPIDNSASRGEREANAALLIKYQTPVLHLDFTNINEFLTNLYDNYPRKDKLRVLIDIGGRVKGENKEIAQEFASLLAKKISPVQFVIYYDETDELHAVSTRNLQHIVYLGSSTDPEVISKKLQGCPVENLAFVLSESQTEGVNHVFAPDCDGAAILGTETTFDKLTQGVNRCRELKEGQRITVILPTALSAIKTIENVIQYTKEIASASLPTRMLSTASGEMLGLIRRDLFTQMLKLPTVKEKHEFMRRDEVRRFFIHSRIEYSVDTGAENDNDIEEIVVTDPNSNRSALKLKTDANKALKKWRTVSTDPTVETNIQNLLNRPMLDIEPSESDLYGEILETQTQTQVQVVAPDLGVKFNPDLIENKIQPWSFNKLVPLSRLLPPPNELGFSFSNNILVSPNFFHIYLEQEQVIITPYMKPIDTVLFIMNSPEDIKVCLLANDEAHDRNLLEQLVNARCPQWLQPTGTIPLTEAARTDRLGKKPYLLLAGKAPDEIEDNMMYQELLEQVRFFAGKFNELVEQKSAYIWLHDEPKRKFDFFESYLQPWRERDPENFEKLKANFSRHMIIFREMSKYPFKHYTEDFAWEELDPDITPADIYIFQLLGRSYQQMNRDYYDYDFKKVETFHMAQSLKQQLKLPAIVLGYVMQHLNHLAEFKLALQELVEPYDSHYLMRLAALTGIAKRHIEEILTIPIEQFLNQYDYNVENQTFSNAEKQAQFELDVLGSFLASNAFPNGARRSFIQPIQNNINNLEGSIQSKLFVNLPITEYKLRYLLNALNVLPETLLALAEIIQEEATAALLVKLGANNPALLNTCLQRFAYSKSVLYQVTEVAVAEQTFIMVLRVAESQGCLFAEEWLTILFQNPHRPIQHLLPLLQRPDINDAFLRHMSQDKRIIEALVQDPQTLIHVLNNIATSTTLDVDFKRQVMLTWVNAYAALPATGELTRDLHYFYQDLIAKMLTVEGDAALAYILNDTFTFSQTLFPDLVSQVIQQAAVNAPEAKRYTLVNGKVYQVLLTHYLTTDTEPLFALLLKESTEDTHLQSLIDSQHLENHAQPFVTKTQALAWLIDHAKANDTILNHIIQDKRFSSTFAIRMLKRNLSANIMEAILSKASVCNADVHIAILNDPTKQAYHAHSVTALMSKLTSMSAAQLLTLIQHASCSEKDHLGKIIPYCHTPEQHQALLAKINTPKTAMQLVQKGVSASIILNMIEKPTLANTQLFALCYHRHPTVDVGYALRNKGITQASAVGFYEFQLILDDHKFTQESLSTFLEDYPFTTQAHSTEEAIRSLQNSADQLHKKSKAFLTHGKASYNQAAQAGTALYFCLRHQLSQYEQKLITKEQLANNLNQVLPRYKAVLSQHRGYRQLMYDIAQAILCLLGVGILMTAYNYATKGQCRLFIWKNESQRIVEKTEQVLNSLNRQ